MIRLLVPCLLAGPASATAQTVVDGTIVGDNYGAAVSVQTVDTAFGDNSSELNAAYATVENGRLFLAVTGNLEDNFNKLEILIDSVPGGENVFSGIPGNDGCGLMTGLTFDAGFEADYHLIARRGFIPFDLDIAQLGTPNFSSYLGIFGGVNGGVGTSGIGPANTFPIDAAYDNSNVAGVIGGNQPSDPIAAQAVDTGFEVSIHLADLGDPTGDIKILVFVNGAAHDFASNQFLGGLAPIIGNLGGDGAGTFTGTVNFDLGAFAGEQFFVVPTSVGTNYCATSLNSTGAPALISASGSASHSANDLVLKATGVPVGQPGLFYYGPQALAGLPFGDGLRCVGGAAGQVIRVFPFAVGDAGGVLASSVDNTLASHAQITPGASLNFQAWFRDPAGAMSGFNLSDGLTVTFLP
jgi:hypothetical protein